MDDDPLRRLGSARLEIRRQLAELDDQLMSAAAETFGVRLDAIADTRDASLGGPPVRASDPADPRGAGAPGEAASSLVEAVQALRARLAVGLDEIAARVHDLGHAPAPPEDEPAGAGPPWESVVFGEELADERAIESDRAALLDDLRRGDPAAGCLVGQLLVFHSAAPAQKPQLLKELGEAYYRWQPMERGPERPLELALSAWLEKACEAAGTRRKILLARIGSRFNATYHRSIDRGGEIVEVLGWIVLREDGSVYQKASVGVR